MPGPDSRFARGGAIFVAFLLGGVAGFLFAAWWNFSPDDGAGGWGSFPTQPVSEWLADGRAMQLKQDFVYLDKHGKPWIAPTGHVVDGASIPRVFWTIVGGPFEGQYRNASIVHDVECDRMTEDFSAVHRMFYEACRCGGLTSRDALLLYAAVYHFGPRWELAQEVRTKMLADGEEISYPVVAGHRIMFGPENEPLQRRLADYVKSHDLTLEQIESLDLSTLPEPTPQ